MTETSIAKLQRTAEGFRRTARMLLFCTVVAIAGVLFLVFQVHSRNEDVEDLRGEVRTLRGNVDELREFVDELQEVTPEEQAQNAAINEAVSRVPEIHNILCEAFPEATNCQV